jgi:hypothetical protein
MVEIGTIRPTQLVTSFGPGSLVNLEHDCVMILGLQFWPKDTIEKKYFKKIMHPYLAKQLKKNYFKMPNADEEGIGIPCISFPQWGVCPHCNTLQRHSSVGKTNKGFFCSICKKPELPMFHSRFVQICDNGHIHEFPWDYWAHSDESSGKNVRKTCTRGKDEYPSFTFTTRKKGTSLSDFVVSCKYCGAENSMGGATDRDKFKRYGLTKCFKNQPWLKTEDKKNCDQQPYGVQTRSSSVYYSASVTALLIPKWLHAVDNLLDKNDGENNMLVRALKNNGLSYDAILDTLKDVAFKKILESYDRETIIQRLELRFNPVDVDVSTEGESLDQEFDDFAKIDKRKIVGVSPDIKVDIDPVDISSSSIGDFHVNTLYQFHRLVSVTVLRGFTRGSPPDPFATESEIERKNPLKFISSKNARDSVTGELNPIDWLPGVETKGEGIFFSFDETVLQEWESRKKVKERFSVLVESYAATMDAQKRSDEVAVLKRFPSPRYILLHTLAHLLIREIADYAGYNESSLKERIYASHGKKMRNGILIHTSSSSSEGSLGGLVRLGDLKYFEEILENAILKSDACSRDPICGDMDPVYAKNEGLSSGSQLTGCSCYSCILLPETSCHNFNNLLDRWMLFDENDGFFRKNLKELR